MKKQTDRSISMVEALLAFLVVLGCNGSLLAGAPVFQAPAANRIGVWNQVGLPGFSAGRVDRPSLAIDGNDTPYVAYRDVANEYKATVMKYDSGSWVTVGPAGFSAGQVRHTPIAFDGSDTPYVAFSDNANENKASVMKFNGSSWVMVGPAGFSPDSASEVSLAIHDANNIYVLYEYSGGGPEETDEIAVMKFNGSSWSMVGSGRFTAGEAYDSSLAIDSSGTPYVMYVDVANGDKASVMKYSGGSWTTVGTAGFSADYVGEYTDIAIDAEGTPFVVYEDGNDRKATVMKYNGSSWVTVGSAGFSTGEAHIPSIAIDSAGNPYVAYGDYAESEKLTVMKYEGSAWSIVDHAGFTSNYVFTPCIAIDSSDHAYVVYEDWGNEGYASVMQTVDGFQYEVAENTTAVGSIFASDPDGDPVVYSIEASIPESDPPFPFPFSINISASISAYSGSDGAYFYLDSGSGELKFVLAPDYDAPVDENGDNIYEFTVTASANGDEVSTTVQVAVSNVPEGPAFLSPPLWITVGTAGFGSSISSSPYFALDSNDTPYMVYRSMSGGYAVAFRYNGSEWENVGSGIINAGDSTETKIAFDSADTPYVVYRDEDNSNKLTVKKFDGESWVVVGTEGFTAASANYKYLSPAIAIDSSDTPYVVYKDYEHSYKATVMKFNGSAWVTVGSAGFSTGSIASTIDQSISIAIDSSDTPYVAYSDSDNSYKATVMKFNGSSWETVGAAGFSADWVRDTSLAFDSHDIAYLAFGDRLGTSYRTTVMRYDGSKWVNVGPRRFTSTDTRYTCLAIDGADIPYVAFAEAYPGGVAVMKYNGSSWEAFGWAGFLGGSAQNTSIAFDSNNSPYVGYWDYANGGRATVIKTVTDEIRIEMLENVMVIGSIGASDPENDPITYSISGDDSALFSIDPSSGLLSFLTAPDFENPQDGDFDNLYEFSIMISADGVEVSRPVYVWVLDAADNNIIITAPDIVGNQLAFTIVGDPDTVVVVEACSDLANPLWIAVATNILTGGSATFSDPALPSLPYRYYRISVP